MGLAEREEVGMEERFAAEDAEEGGVVLPRAGDDAVQLRQRERVRRIGLGDPAAPAPQVAAVGDGKHQESGEERLPLALPALERPHRPPSAPREPQEIHDDASRTAAQDPEQHGNHRSAVLPEQAKLPVLQAFTKGGAVHRRRRDRLVQRAVQPGLVRLGEDNRVTRAYPRAGGTVGLAVVGIDDADGGPLDGEDAEEAKVHAFPALDAAVRINRREPRDPRGRRGGLAVIRRDRHGADGGKRRVDGFLPEIQIARGRGEEHADRARLAGENRLRAGETPEGLAILRRQIAEVRNVHDRNRRLCAGGTDRRDLLRGDPPVGSAMADDDAHRFRSKAINVSPRRM